MTKLTNFLITGLLALAMVPVTSAHITTNAPAVVWQQDVFTHQDAGMAGWYVVDP